MADEIGRDNMQSDEERRAYLEARKKAKAKAEAIKGFYIHAFVFVVVIIGLTGLNYSSTQSDPEQAWWVQWVALGWGAGVLAHMLFTFSSFRFFGADWEEKKIQQIMAQEQQKAPRKEG